MDRTAWTRLALAGLLAGAGCATSGAGEAPLEGTAWVARDIGDAAMIEGVRSTLEFGAEGRVFGDTACNRYNGSLERDEDGRVSFGAIASTRRACRPAVMDQEQRFLEALGRTRRIERDGDWLRLRGEGGEVLARLTPTEPSGD